MHISRNIIKYMLNTLDYICDGLGLGSELSYSKKRLRDKIFTVWSLWVFGEKLLWLHQWLPYLCSPVGYIKKFAKIIAV